RAVGAGNARINAPRGGANRGAHHKGAFREPQPGTKKPPRRAALVLRTEGLLPASHSAWWSQNAPKPRAYRPSNARMVSKARRERRRMPLTSTPSRPPKAHIARATHRVKSRM